jgi:hypothetical protein
MASQRRGGVIFLKINAEMYQAKGSFTYGLGKNLRDAIVGYDGIHGYKETIQVPFIEGEITDSPELSLDQLSEITDGTVTLELANGKTIVLRNAWHANKDGLTGQTEEGNIPVRFEGRQAEEIR